MRRSLRLLSASAGAAALAGTTLLALSSGSASAVDFPTASFVVYRVGTAGGTLANSGAPVSLVTYASTGSGAAAATVDVPSTTVGTAHRLTATGLSRSEGQLTRSEDGTLLAFTGYDAAVGQTGPDGAPGDVAQQSLTASDPAVVGRVIGLLDGAGHLNTATSVVGSAVPHVVRTAVTADGQALYLGGSGGVLSTTRGASTATSVLDASGAAFDANDLQVSGGTLLASGANYLQPTTRLVTVGAGTPALTGLPGVPSGTLPGAFVLLNLTDKDFAGTGGDTLYVVNGAEKSGAIDKLSYDGTTWTKQGTVALDGATGLAGRVLNHQVLLAATTPQGLYTLGEQDGTASGFTSDAPHLLASAAAGTEFRGVALAPTGSVLSTDPLPGVVISVPAQGQHINNLTTSALVKGTASAAHGLSSVTIALDSGAAVPAVTSNGGTIWSKAYDLTKLSVGSHTLTVRVVEKGTGTATSLVRTFFRDGVPAGAVGPATASFFDTRVTRTTGWRTNAYPASPDRRSLLTTVTPKVTFTTYGRGLDLHFQRRNDGGIARLTVDGKAFTIDLRSPTTGDAVKALRGLTPGKHAITIQALHQRSAGSKGFVIVLGYFRVYA